jgi:hypothetical protein
MVLRLQQTVRHWIRPGASMQLSLFLVNRLYLDPQHLIPIVNPGLAVSAWSLEMCILRVISYAAVFFELSVSWTEIASHGKRRYYYFELRNVVLSLKTTRLTNQPGGASVASKHEHLSKLVSATLHPI